MPLTFTSVTEDDLPAILEIYNHYVLNSTATFHEHLLNLDEMRQMLFFNDPRYGAFLIKQAEDVCGYCILARFHEREAYRGTTTVTVYLNPAWLGQGIGRAALDFLEQEALKREFHVLMAIICAENTASIKLFQRAGYEQCGYFRQVGRKFGRQLDVVYYQKLI